MKAYSEVIFFQEICSSFLNFYFSGTVSLSRLPEFFNTWGQSCARYRADFVQQFQNPRHWTLSTVSKHLKC